MASSLNGYSWLALNENRLRLLSILLIATILIFSALVDTRLLFLIFSMLSFLLVLKNSELVLYILIVFAFLRLDAWFSGVFSLPFGKLLFLFAVTSILATILFGRHRLNRLSLPLVLYLFFIVAYFAFGAINSTSEGLVFWVEDTVYALGYLLAIYLLLNGRDKLKKAIWLIYVIGLFSSLMNIYEFLHPYSFALSHSTGRAAGLLKNANTSAFIVNISFIASVFLVRTSKSVKFSILFLISQALLFAGVFVTFSREGLIIFAMSFIAQFFALRGRKIFLALALVMLIACTTFISARYVTSSAGIDVQRSFLKISSFLSGQIDDNDRLFLLKYHIQRFVANPLTGNGLYSALIYSVPRDGIIGNGVPNGPHNTLALILSEAGIFPAIVYAFWLIFTFLYLTKKLLNSRGEEERALSGVVLLFFVVLFIHHFFSHMILFARYAMAIFAMSVLPFNVSGDSGSRQSAKRSRN